MRSGVLALTASGVVLTGVLAYLLLFWFAFPKWWPEVVIRHSPSLNHVLLADSYRFEQASKPAPSGGVIHPEQQTADYSRFEKRLGAEIYAAMAACDDGGGGRKRASILRYLGEHMNQQKARILLWRYRDGGDGEADWILQRYTNSLDQGVKNTGLKYDRLDPPRKADEIRPDRMDPDAWKSPGR
jgi:hypothetical protein